MKDDHMFLCPVCGGATFLLFPVEEVGEEVENTERFIAACANDECSFETEIKMK